MSSKTAASARSLALRALMRIEADGAYSNITIDQLLRENRLSGRDKAFVSLLVYGVLEKKLLLDYNLSRLSSRNINETELLVRMILRMGLYQLHFADKVPASAAVNESVTLCRQLEPRASGYVNAVLRAASGEKELRLPEKRRGKNKYLSVKYSCPESIIRLWRESYGDDLAEGILSALDGRAPVYARVNTLKTNPEELICLLEEHGVAAEKNGLIEDSISLSETGAATELEEYRKGLFHVQDISSQLCCRFLGAKPGMTVIDACSAPGGKSFTTAQYMENKGLLIACDLYEHRLRLVEDGAGRLGIDIINTKVGDSSKPDDLPPADRVLCDVPCSGLGVIRRKPELRYKEDTGADVLPCVQYGILCSCARHLKSGGVLVYSTCTLNPAENGDNIRRFLSEHEEFEPYPLSLPAGIQRLWDEKENELTLFPQPGGTDGFFISAVRRK